MGHHATTPKHRHCRWCRELRWTTATEMKDHAGICRRLKQLGLLRAEQAGTIKIIQPQRDMR